MYHKEKRGQVAVLDLFIAAVIFGILVATIMFTWNEYNIKIEKHIEYNDLIIKTFHIADLLTQYPGKPSTWELPRPLSHSTEQQTSITTIGLVYEEGIIDEYKLEKFLNTSYNETKDIFNINNYEYYFKIINLDGSDLNPIIEKGILQNKTKVSIRRLVIYQNEEAILQFQLQEK
ncbi:MAG: hypothetical protein ABIH25_00765 [Candidatus Woesearchaeota archaeon]